MPLGWPLSSCRLALARLGLRLVDVAALAACGAWLVVCRPEVGVSVRTALESELEPGLHVDHVVDLLSVRVSAEVADGGVSGEDAETLSE
jgi:hypothetical protein